MYSAQIQRAACLLQEGAGGIQWLVDWRRGTSIIPEPKANPMKLGDDLETGFVALDYIEPLE